MKKESIKKIGAASTAVALVAGSMAVAPVMSAFANGDVKINSSRGESVTETFKAYQMFSGIVNGTNRDDKKISEPKFLSGMEEVFKKAYKAYTGTKSNDTTTKIAQFEAATDENKKAQLAVEIIKELMPTSSTTEAAAANSFGYILSQEIKNSGATATTMTAGTSTSLADGYWVIVADTVGESGTGAIFAGVNGTPLNIDQKEAVPTLKKFVKDDDATATDGSEWEKEADQTVGSTLNFKLEGTIADNYDAYKTYKYVITDTPTNMTINNDVVVKVDDQTIEGVSSIAGNKLVVTFEDLKIYAATKPAKVEVTYSATVNGASAATKENTAVLTYSSTPGTDKTADTQAVKTTVKSYMFNLKKTDVDGKALQNAKFTVENQKGKKIIMNGAVTNEAAEGGITISNADGILTLDGLDSGTYKITETEAPNGYNKLFKEFYVTINKDGSLKVTKDGTNKIDSSDLNDGKVSDADASRTVTVKNSSGINLPVTGQQGFMLITLAGGIVLVATLGGTIVRRRKSEKDAE